MKSSNDIHLMQKNLEIVTQSGDNIIDSQVEVESKLFISRLSITNTNDIQNQIYRNSPSIHLPRNPGSPPSQSFKNQIKQIKVVVNMQINPDPLSKNTRLSQIQLNNLSVCMNPPDPIHDEPSYHKSIQENMKISKFNPSKQIKQPMPPLPLSTLIFGIDASGFLKDNFFNNFNPLKYYNTKIPHKTLKGFTFPTSMDKNCQQLASKIYFDKISDVSMAYEKYKQEALPSVQSFINKFNQFKQTLKYIPHKQLIQYDWGKDDLQINEIKQHLSRTIPKQFQFTIFPINSLKKASRKINMIVKFLIKKRSPTSENYINLRKNLWQATQYYLRADWKQKPIYKNELKKIITIIDFL